MLIALFVSRINARCFDFKFDRAFGYIGFVNREIATELIESAVVVTNTLVFGAKNYHRVRGINFVCSRCLGDGCVSNKADDE